MNKRIKELAAQAEKEVNEIFVWWPEGPDRADVIQEKFAELIIAECGKAFWTEECFVSDLAIEYYNRQVGKIRRRFE